MGWIDLVPDKDRGRAGGEANGKLDPGKSGAFVFAHDDGVWFAFVVPTHDAMRLRHGWAPSLCGLMPGKAGPSSPRYTSSSG
jgi:hypothetical protein